LDNTQTTTRMDLKSGRENEKTHLRLGHPHGAALLQIDRIAQLSVPGLLVAQRDLGAKDV